MNGSIFLLQDGGNLLRMNEARYDSENLLQQLLAKYPDLLAGDQIDSEEPRRWLLVSREMSVPGEEGGAGRWSLDHLFLDQDGIPTLVEVKRSSDIRLRREVVGQMLDYAANGIVYWPIEAVQAAFARTCEASGSDPDEELANLIGAEGALDDFWRRVKTNLQAGRIRMVFVADEIPAELSRVVEFLNGQMDPAEVLAVEIKQFVGETMKTLVPRVIGQTARKLSPGPKPIREPITEQEFFIDFDASRPESERQVGRKIIAWARRQGLKDNFKMGKGRATYVPILRMRDQEFYPISLNARGTVAVQMRWLRDHPPFSNSAKREELEQKLSSIPGFRVASAGMEGFPKVPVESLTSEPALRSLVETLDWILNEIRLGHP